jgi:outer membrane protein OmpA-like peptidoglycan-associated protein
MHEASPSAPVSPLEDLLPPDAGPARPQLMLIASVSALVLFMGLAIQREAPLIERDIRDRATAALTDAGMGWARVKVDGRDVTLGGGAPSAEARSEAYRLTAEIAGVRVVHDVATVAPEQTEAAPEAPPPAVLPYALVLRSDGAHLTLAGDVPDDAETSRLVDLAGKRFAVADVKDALARGARSAPPDWSDAAAAALEALVLLEHGEARVGALRVDLDGVAADRGLRARTRRLLQRGLPASFKSSTHILLVTQPETTAASCQPQLDSLLAAAGVEFDAGSAALRPDSVPVLAEVAEIVQGCAPARFEVAGHTDDRGDPDTNLRLSQARAQAVLDYLVELGVAAERISARGYGEAQPLVRGTSPEARARNRRIEIRVERQG